MKLKLKNLRQQEFDIEIESDKKTVKDLKLEIEKAYGFDASLIKLLHSGLVLEDAKTLEDYKIKEGNVVIMMATKKKQVEQPPQPAPNPNPQPVPNPNPQPNPQPQEQPKPSENKPNYSEQVNSLVDMGYEKEKAEKAIQAAHGSVDLALEFLNSGNIPESTGNVNIPGSGSNLPPELVKNASIIKIICMNNPEKITGLLNMFKERHPNLINLMKLHEEEFKNLLVSPITQEDINNFKEIEQELRRPQGPSIRLTKEESDAVKRLQELGFSQAEAVQAYIACDKNEEMAANFLFEQKMREEEENQNNPNPNQGQGQGQG